MSRLRIAAAIASVLNVLLAIPAMAQTGGTVQVTQPTVVLGNPRGDSVVVGSVPAGTRLEVLDRQGPWYLVAAPAGTTSWKRGWIRPQSAEVRPAGTAAAQRPAAKRRDRLHIRAFGEAGSTRFTASDSFETIIGHTFGTLYGGGAQVAFANGAFLQASVDRFQKTGSRTLVSATEVFRLELPNLITVTPILATVGYRDVGAKRTIPYVGFGLGWHTLKEESPSLSGDGNVNEGHIGYHVLGGAEFFVFPGLWVAGEGRWTGVPKALGDFGVSKAFDEKDLGGATLQFKVIVGY